MNAVLFPNSCGLRCVPTVFSPVKLPTVSARETADGVPCFFSQRGISLASVLTIRCEGNGRGRSRRKNTPDKSPKEDGTPKSPSSDIGRSKSSSQEDIIALFRRIQSSISKGELKVPRNRKPNILKTKQSAESVLETSRRYPTRDKYSRKQENIASLKSKSPSQDEASEDAPPPQDFKLPRPVSNFVKRSPIPPVTSTEASIQEVAEGRSTVEVADVGLGLQEIKDMKLSELKELAKGKGVKGYSKLKKGELFELLEGLL